MGDVKDNQSADKAARLKSSALLDGRLPAPYYDDGNGRTIYHGDARELIRMGNEIDTVVSDPPYPNAGKHFDDYVKDARQVMSMRIARQWLIFWHELENPPIAMPYVAKHIWFRTNTNRPDNYEAIYHYAADGKKRASRVLPYPVIAMGLTGCAEATAHPTQKSERLMQRLLTIVRPKGLVCDPFAGSGTTLVAAKLEGLACLGIEINERYCEIAANRLRQGVLW